MCLVQFRRTQSLKPRAESFWALLTFDARSRIGISYDPLVSDVTQLLNAVGAGDPKAADQLLPLVYEELRKLAVVRMANEKAGHTLQPTALVHEAWLKIAGDGKGHIANRRHFFKAAATAMQQILIDTARRKQRLKHGANQIGDELHESRIAVAVPPEELLAVHEALEGLTAEEPLAGELVKLRYFVGLTMEEAAEVLGLALRKTQRLWAFARAWLRTELDAEKK